MAGGAFYSLSHRPAGQLCGFPPHSDDNPVERTLEVPQVLSSKDISCVSMQDGAEREHQRKQGVSSAFSV